MPAPPALRPPQIIRRTADLRRAVDRLRACPLLAVDTESNSLFAYSERVCLVQLSTRERDLIIDPLAVDDMSPLGDLVADPAIEVVFHAAEYDIISLKRDFGFSFANLFDTMMAARVCGWSKTGLGNILEEQFGVVVDKKYQRADWSRRPLPPDQLRYAQMDTHFLPVLRDRLWAELEAQRRLTEAQEMFAALCALPAAEFHFDPEGFWRIQAVRDLGLRQVAIVRELYLLRNAIARRLNRPPFKVFSDRALVALAELAPRRLEDLRSAGGLSTQLIQRDGAAILEAVARGRQTAPPRPPQRRKAPDPAIQERYEALHEWRKQRAVERGVESDVIVPRETLWALARQMPASVDELDDIPGLGPWRRAEYGVELISMLKRLDGNS
jgi:ribonuclease D